MSIALDLVTEYENLSRKEVGKANKEVIRNKLVKLKDDLGDTHMGLRTGIIRSLVDFKSLRKYQPKDSAAQNYKLVELQAMLTAARSVLLPPHNQDNPIYPTLRELMLFIKNSGTIVVREFPSTFKSFLLQLPVPEMTGVVSVNNIEILARNDVISTQQKAHFQRVLATQTQATVQEKQALRAFVREQFPKFWIQGRREVMQASNQPKKNTMAINLDFTEQCIKDLNRAQSDPDFLDILHFLRTYLNQEQLPAPQNNAEVLSYQNLLKLYERNLASYRKSFFNGRLQPLPPNLHSTSLSDYGMELWYGYALLNFVHQGNSFWYAHLLGGWQMHQMQLLGPTLDLNRNYAGLKGGFNREIHPDPRKKEVTLILRSGFQLNDGGQNHMIQDITLRALFGFDTVKDSKGGDRVVALKQQLKGLDYQF